MKAVFPYQYIPQLPTFAYECLVGLNIKEREAEARGTAEQPLSDKPPLKQCGETYKLTAGRKSHWSCSVKKDVLKNFTKFTGKHLWQSFFK